MTHKFIVRFTRPDTNGTYCYYAPGLGHWPSDPKQAFEFSNSQAATRAANDVIHGPSNAFWNCEREYAERTRRTHRGWKFDILETDA